MFHPLPGSHHVPRQNAKYVGPLDSNHPLNVTLVLSHPVDGSDKSQLEAFCQENHLDVTPIDAHHWRLSGPAKNFSEAFKVNFHQHDHPNGTRYHAHDGPIYVPSALLPHVRHVFGFDTAPVARPYFKRHTAKAASSEGPYTPLQLASIYNFPPGDGTGQTVGIIELGGGYVMSDLQTYFRQLGISDTPNVTSVGVNGATNNPWDPSGADGEVVLDIEIVAALVPKAKINVYFTPNTDQGFYDAIHQAILGGAGVVSISWGGPEVYWSSAAMSSFNALFESAPHVTVCVASGDNGSADGVQDGSPHCDYPASSPYVLGCGGTRLRVSGSSISSETVWNDEEGASGGGISTFFKQPSYQNGVAYLKGKNRGVPDVCGVADPETGYVIYLQGQDTVIGGTSAVAPLWSGLITRINQALNTKVGFINPKLYSSASVCHDITQGNNGTYSARIGWDGCSGLGSPNGEAILNLLKTAPAASTHPAPAHPAPKH
jgi:kumamolisin